MIKTDCISEFTVELLMHIPYAYWAYTNGLLEKTISCMDTKPFYYFSPDHEEKYDITWLFIYQWGFKILDDEERWNYVQENYALKQAAFTKQGDKLQPVYFVMKKGGGKRKGSAFERAVARLFDSLYSAPDGTFWRTPNSGGWKEPGDVTLRKSENISGVFFFVIECKSIRDVNPLEILDNRPNKILLKWWDQVLKEQQDCLKRYVGKNETMVRPIVVFKKNASPTFVMFNPTMFHDELVPDTDIMIRIKSSPYWLCICRWDDFADNFKRIYLKEEE